jgi:hypothetical protein
VVQLLLMIFVKWDCFLYLYQVLHLLGLFLFHPTQITLFLI